MSSVVVLLQSHAAHSLTLKPHCPKASGAGLKSITPAGLMLGMVCRLEQLPVGVTLNFSWEVPWKTSSEAQGLGATSSSSRAEMIAGPAMNVGPARGQYTVQYSTLGSALQPAFGSSPGAAVRTSAAAQRRLLGREEMLYAIAGEALQCGPVDAVSLCHGLDHVSQGCCCT